MEARDWLDKINALPLKEPVRVMNVCGGHERSITTAGLRTALNSLITLIPGPGCPVCVCPEEDIYHAIRLSFEPGVIVTAFGDMLRVPANVPRSEAGSLEQARARGGAVRPVASPAESVKIATENPDARVVFFAAGFETTMAPLAACIAQGFPPNLLVLLSGRLTWPAVQSLLDAPDGPPDFDALIAPGHVSAIMGAEEWGFVPRAHNLPCAVAGFNTTSILKGLYAVLLQKIEGVARLENCYREVVHPHGNVSARRLMAAAFDVVPARWRGIGVIPGSGYALAQAHAAHDARKIFSLTDDAARRRIGEMPPGCACAKVVLGRITPLQCPLYGKACRPDNPVGPCMVSDEGACRIWWAGGHRTSRAA